MAYASLKYSGQTCPKDCATSHAERPRRPSKTPAEHQNAQHRRRRRLLPVGGGLRGRGCVAAEICRKDGCSSVLSAEHPDTDRFRGRHGRPRLPFDRDGGLSASRSNVRTGESLEDCAAVISRLCDAIVVRHHEDGAATRMAAKSQTPVVNAGDGWNEHPTQALHRYLRAAPRPRHDQGQEHRVWRRSTRSDRPLAGATAAVRRTEGDRVLSSAPLRGAERHLACNLRKSNSPPGHCRHQICADRLPGDHDGSVRHVRYRGTRRVRLCLAECDAGQPRHHSPKKSNRPVRTHCSTIRCLGTTRSIRHAMTCQMPCISSRFGCRSSCAWRCWTGCCPRTERSAAAMSVSRGSRTAPGRDVV